MTGNWRRKEGRKEADELLIVKFYFRFCLLKQARASATWWVVVARAWRKNPWLLVFRPDVSGRRKLAAASAFATEPLSPLQSVVSQRQLCVGSALMAQLTYRIFRIARRGQKP